MRKNISSAYSCTLICLAALGGYAAGILTLLAVRPDAILPIRLSGHNAFAEPSDSRQKASITVTAGAASGLRIQHQDAALAEKSGLQQRTLLQVQEQQEQQQPRQGWYVHPSENQFVAIAKQTGTDKFWKHNYQTLYGRLFELSGMRPHIKKFLEIGLGCDMKYGPGRSAKLWRQYLPPQTEIWMAEYNGTCVAQHAEVLKQLRINPLVGDQADIATLQEWVAASGGGFDVIIDDGGHTNMQMYNTFAVLFDAAVRPGGVYVIEDIFISRSVSFVDGDKTHVMIDVIKDWIEGLVMPPHGAWHPRKQVHPYRPHWKLPRHVKSIECYSHVCAIVKCFEDDIWCYSHTSEPLPSIVLKEAAAKAPAGMPKL